MRATIDWPANGYSDGFGVDGTRPWRPAPDDPLTPARDALLALARNRPRHAARDPTTLTPIQIREFLVPDRARPVMLDCLYSQRLTLPANPIYPAVSLKSGSLPEIRE